MKLNTTVYLFSDSPKFNIDAIPDFGTFRRDDSALLYSTLVLNNKEIFDKLQKNINLVYCSDICDKEFMPEELKDNCIQLFFGDTKDKNNFIKSLSEKIFSLSDNNLIIFSDSIGISHDDILKAINLLQIEDEVIVLGKTAGGKVAFIGFNSFNKNLFLHLSWDNLNFDYLLAKVNEHENLVHILGNYMLVNSVADFKYLYGELSKKESLAYCSQNMHERFTNLFIEYKELLK